MRNTEVEMMLPEKEQWLHVVAGVIFNPVGDAVLLARRPLGKHQGGKWEFPGGKVESDEAASFALHRELDEELGIQINLLTASPFVDIRHRYPDKNIWLDVWKITGFSGQPDGREGQEVRWFALEELSGLDFPEANTPIIEQLLQ